MAHLRICSFENEIAISVMRIKTCSEHRARGITSEFRAVVSETLRFKNLKQGVGSFKIEHFVTKKQDSMQGC